MLPATEPSRTRTRPLGLPQAVCWFLAATAILWTIALACVAFSRLHHLGYPYRDFLLHTQNAHPDINDLFPRFRYLHTLQFFTFDPDYPFMYPAPVALLYRAFYSFTHYLRAYMLFSGLAAVCVAFAFRAWLIARGLSSFAATLLAAFTAVTSYPLMFTMHQANMEVCVWLIVMAALFLLFQHRDLPAAVLLGIAISMKIFPAVYLALFLVQKKWRPIFVAAISAVLITVPSLYFLYPDVRTSWRLNSLAVGKFKTLITLQPIYTFLLDHSVFGFYKAAVFHHLRGPIPPTIFTIYMACAVVFGIAVCLRLRQLPALNQVFGLTILSIWLPPTSFDYTLLHLYVPFALLVAYSLQHRGTSRPLNWAFVLLAVLLSPETEITHATHILAGPLKCVALAALLALVLTYPFKGGELDAQLQPQPATS